jgi:coenzyme F420-reducing hydrogenase beta subunit
VRTATQELLERVIHPGLSVGSGVYSIIDPELRTVLGESGEYLHPALTPAYEGPADALLSVSAFGDGASEDSIAGALFGSQPAIRFDQVAGYYAAAYAGWVVGPGRERGSSGGLTTWLLEALLEGKHVDGVIHMGASQSNDGTLFSYRLSHNVDELRANAKSRYYPGELSESLREARASGGRYVLVAIPSIAYEVRLLQEHDPTFRRTVPYVVGLICGHQKSARYAEYLGWRSGIDPGHLRSIDFRKKVEGQPANTYSTEFVGVFGGEQRRFVREQSQLLGTDWGLGLFKSKFSDFTEDILNETADVVFGDAWLPRYVRDGRGTNVVVVRNAELGKLLTSGVDTRQIHLEPIPITDVLRSQGSLVRHNVLELPFRVGELESGLLHRAVRRPRQPAVPWSRRRIQRTRLELSRRGASAYADARASGSLDVFDEVIQPLVAKYHRAQGLARVDGKLREGPRAIAETAWRRLVR